MPILWILGLVLWFAGVIWLVVISFQTGQSTGEKILWAVVNFFCQPLAGIIFYIMRKQGLVPLILVIIGWLMLVIGGYSAGGMMSVPGTIPQ